MTEIKIVGNTGGAVQAVKQLNTELNQTEQEQKRIKKSTKDTTKEMKEGAKESGSAWTELNSKLEVVGKGIGYVKDAFIKFHEIQIKGRKENLQWESMMNSTRADEIQKNLGKINESFGDNVDKATKWRMAYASAFSDVKYDMDAFSNIAQNMAQRTGKDLNEMIEELQQGLLKGDLGILEDNGILHNADLEMQKYAGSIGKTVDKLTDFEKRQGQANIVMRYLNTEFNNSKPLHDDYIETTNKLSKVTEDFAGDVSRLTDEFIALNTEAGNLSIKKQMEKVAQDIQDAKKIISDGEAPYTPSFGADDFYGVGVIDDVGSDLAVKNAKEGLKKHESKLLTLMNNQSRILTGKLLSDYKIRGVETVAEMKEIQKNIDIAIEKAEIGLDKYSGSNEDLFSEQGKAAYVNLQALKNVRAETVKELELIKGIKTEDKKDDGRQEKIIASKWKRFERINKIKHEEALKNVAQNDKKIAEQAESVNLDDIFETGIKPSNIDEDVYEMRKKKTIDYNNWKKANRIAQMREETAMEEKFKDYMVGAANNMYSGLLEGRANFLQETIAMSMKRAGAEIFNDGLQGLWQGGRWALSPYPTMAAQGVATIGYSLAEIGAGLALGYAGTKIMPKTGKASEGKDTTAKDSNKINDNKKQEYKVNTYIFPSEREYLQSLQKSNNKLNFHG